MKLLHLEINCQADGACAAFFVTNWFLILAWKYKKSQPVQIHTSQGLKEIIQKSKRLLENLAMKSKAFGQLTKPV